MGNSRTEFHEKSMHCAFVKILEQKESIFPNGNQGNECNSCVTSTDTTGTNIFSHYWLSIYKKQ